ncbi:hypothetical protein GCM10010982_26610 [Bowmanella pacifica]|uniref:Uncharacterized protein n=1 Tax=Bowmanella pacifica TaxID=502051 RepID=A0A918DK39_9ALTE|nr:hypothetical protein GCM10010982_26610 [Bowmanella pacifica]
MWISSKKRQDLCRAAFTAIKFNAKACMAGLAFWQMARQSKACSLAKGYDNLINDG